MFSRTESLHLWENFMYMRVSHMRSGCLGMARKAIITGPGQVLQPLRPWPDHYLC